MKSKYYIKMLLSPSSNVVGINYYHCGSTPILSESMLKDSEKIQLILESLTKEEYEILIRMKKQEIYTTNLVLNKLICYT